ncbi:COG1470 family protein [Streptomyces nondiastaticus]|uniref:COG1470 family protein n=1 Tax=Streptomyces nondiastaticus TaxID=3154512 RepID=UPI003F4DA32E
MRPRLLTALASVILAASAAPAAGVARAAADDDRAAAWSAAPAPAGTAAPGPDDRTSFYLEGAPGAVLTDKLALVNPTDSARSLELRASAPWISLGRRQVRVPARMRADVPLTVTVPGDGNGDRSGAVVVTGEGREVRVPLALRVSGAPALPALAVENVRVSSAADGRGAVIRYAVVNRGNTVLAPRLALRADGIFGTVLRRTVSDSPAALPPGRAVQRVERWADAPRLDSVTVRVTAAAEGGVRASGSASYTPWRWVVPVGGGGVLGVLGAVVLVRRVVVRRRGLRGRVLDRIFTAPHPPAQTHPALGATNTRQRPGPCPCGPGASLVALLLAVFLLLSSAGAAVADGPRLSLDRPEAGKGSAVVVTGEGWRPGALLTLLVCGQNMVGGTNDCANADGRTVTTGSDGRFRREVFVAEPPRPCPCVVHVATVMGDAQAVDVPLVVAGHPVVPVPSSARLGVLAARLEGSSGLLTWFGAPPTRRLVVTVGNLGSGVVKDPVFRVGTARGVLAPAWEERKWHGTVPAGQRARVVFDVELAAGAHGPYEVSLKYGEKVLVAEPWDVARPWGVVLFWVLLGGVVAVGLFRVGMLLVDRLRPRPPVPETAGRPVLPWFAPGTLPPPD